MIAPAFSVAVDNRRFQDSHPKPTIYPSDTLQPLRQKVNALFKAKLGKIAPNASPSWKAMLLGKSKYKPVGFPVCGVHFKTPESYKKQECITLTAFSSTDGLPENSQGNDSEGRAGRDTDDVEGSSPSATHFTGTSSCSPTAVATRATLPTPAPVSRIEAIALSTHPLARPGPPQAELSISKPSMLPTQNATSSKASGSLEIGNVSMQPPIQLSMWPQSSALNGDANSFQPTFLTQQWQQNVLQQSTVDASMHTTLLEFQQYQKSAAEKLKMIRQIQNLNQHFGTKNAQ